MKKHSYLAEFTRWLCFSYQFSSELIQCSSMSVSYRKNDKDTILVVYLTVPIGQLHAIKQ